MSSILFNLGAACQVWINAVNHVNKTKQEGIQKKLDNNFPQIKTSCNVSNYYVQIYGVIFNF